MVSPTISAQTLIQELEAKTDLIVVDCRCSLTDPKAGYRLYSEGHPSGAVFADLEQDLSAPISTNTGRHPLPTVSQFQDFVRTLGIHNNSEVVVYDDANGAFAARLWWMLRVLGIHHVRVLEGGIQAYVKAGGVMEEGVVERSPGTFTTTAYWPVVTTEQVASDGHITLIDARAVERYQGQHESIDAKAGHIPGARNLPFANNLNDDGTFKTPAEITENFQALETQGDVAVMCGSGVTACHLLLARAVAGLPAYPLYAGSWSEWITDPARPVETGSPGP